MKEKYIETLNKLALKAYKHKEIPVGAVVVDHRGKIIGKGYNTKQRKHNVMGHAEINAILKASKKTKDWRLDGCTLYSTLEPCEMCKKIIEVSRIKTVYYNISKIEKNGEQKTKYNKINSSKIDCDLLKTFFKNMR